MNAEVELTRWRWSCDRTVGLVLVGYMLMQLSRSIMQNIGSESYNNSFYAEMMINYEGGFVRRGLIGQLLYWVYSFTGWSHLEYVVLPLSLAFCLGVIVFFLYRFHKLNYCWWIICSPMFCGFLISFVRKDFILYAILIGMLYLLRSDSLRDGRKLFATMLFCLGLVIHEAFIFFGFPVYALLLWKGNGGRWVNNLLMTAIVLITFGLMCISKGDRDMAVTVINSWNAIIEGSPFVFDSSNSIGALAWSTIDTFGMHGSFNFIDSYGSWQGLFVRPVTMVAAYYFIMNFIWVFKRRNSEPDETDRTNLTTVFVITAVCLIPMFTILSVDYGRLYQYIFVTSFAAFVIIPKERLASILPSYLTRVVMNFNRRLNHVVPPSKGLMLVLLFFLAESPWRYSLTEAMYTSVYGQYALLFGRVVKESVNMVASLL